MSTVTTMIIRDAAYLDFSWINATGGIQGGSCFVDVEIECDIDDESQTQIGFGFQSVRQLLKVLLEHPSSGYDHKLWCIHGISNFDLHVSDTGCEIVSTPALTIQHAPNSVILFQHESTELNEALAKELDTYLFENIRKTFGEEIFGVKVAIRTEPQTRHLNHVPFSFVHGLKNSLTFGHQNISHGHSAFIEWTHSPLFKPDCFSCQSGVQHLMQAAAYLDNSILIKRENILEQTTSEIVVGYESERGAYQATYLTGHNKIVIMDNETSVENVIHWFVTHFRGALEMAHIESFFISEGLNRGAAVQLNF